MTNQEILNTIKPFIDQKLPYLDWEEETLIDDGFRYKSHLLENSYLVFGIFSNQVIYPQILVAKYEINDFWFNLAKYVFPKRDGEGYHRLDNHPNDIGVSDIGVFKKDFDFYIRQCQKLIEYLESERQEDLERTKRNYKCFHSEVTFKSHIQDINRRYDMKIDLSHKIIERILGKV